MIIETKSDMRLGGILEGTNFWGGVESHDLLVCPECGDEHTHLDRTVMYQRAEDGLSNMIDVDSCDGVVIGTTDTNPSPRRDAVVLHYRGECGHGFTVTFIQHKGNTYAWTTRADLEGDE